MGRFPRTEIASRYLPAFPNAHETNSGFGDPPSVSRMVAADGTYPFWDSAILQGFDDGRVQDTLLGKR